MVSFRRLYRPYIVTAVLGVFSAAAFTAIIGSRERALRAENDLGRLRTEERTLILGAPAPTKENTDKIEADLEKVSEAVVLWQDHFFQRTNPVLPLTHAPTTRTDAFFDLAAFAEGMRQRAVERGVTLAQDEYFGFSGFAHEGPEPELIPLIFQQRLAIQAVVTALFDSQPEKLSSVQRERPFTKATEKKAKPGAVAVSRDLFEPDPRSRLNFATAVTRQAYRITFQGRTITLRRFIERLVKLEQPMVIRMVEVEPAGPETPPLISVGSAPRSEVGKADALATEHPLVVPVSLKFTVTVESVTPGEFVDTPSAKPSGPSS